MVWQPTLETLLWFNVSVLWPADIPLLKEAWSLPACYQLESPILCFPCWPGLTVAVTWHLWGPPSSGQHRKDYNCTIPHETSSPLSHEQNQWQLPPPPHPHNWRKLQTNLSNLSIGVKHMFWVLVVYYRLCLNINLPSSCSSVFSWLLFSIWAKTTVAGSTWEKKMK